MTEKLKKHIRNIDLNGGKRSCRISLQGGLAGITDTYRFLVMPEDAVSEVHLPEKEIKRGKIFDDILALDASPQMSYERMTLPSLKQMKEGIWTVAGNARSVRVLWSEDGAFAFNARWLAEAMDALHARTMFTSGTSGFPVIIYQDDEVNAEIKEYIWPANNEGHWVGFFAPPD